MLSCKIKGSTLEKVECAIQRAFEHGENTSVAGIMAAKSAGINPQMEEIHLIRYRVIMALT